MAMIMLMSIKNFLKDGMKMVKNLKRINITLDVLLLNNLIH